MLATAQVVRQERLIFSLCRRRDDVEGWPEMMVLERIGWLFPVRGRWLLYLIAALLIACVVWNAYLVVSFPVPPLEWRLPHNAQPPLGLPHG